MLAEKITKIVNEQQGEVAAARAALIGEYGRELLSDDPSPERIAALADKLGVSGTRLRFHAHVADLIRAKRAEADAARAASAHAQAEFAALKAEFDSLRPALARAHEIDRLMQGARARLNGYGGGFIEGVLSQLYATMPWVNNPGNFRDNIDAFKATPFCYSIDPILAALKREARS